MKTRSAAAAAAIGMLSSITIVLCACSSERDAAIYNSTGYVQQNGGNIENLTSESESTNINEPAESAVPTAPTPEAPPKFDDPDSYIIYDSSTDTYYLTEEEEQLGKESLFVGDSICYGFSTWGVVDSKNVYATGSVGTRNLFDYEMYYLSKPAKFEYVLNEVKPKHIFFWMGMNDVNLISSEEYCENYGKIIDTALENSSADVYICAITPISRLTFTNPAYIKEFNFAIRRYVKMNYRERVHIINFGEPLKNDLGILDEQYNGGDGIHLSRKAYYVAMHEIAKQMKE